MRLMYGAPPRPKSKRSQILDGLSELEGPPKADPPPEHAKEELEAFTTIVNALRPLSAEQKRRVLRSVATWFGMTIS